MFCYGGNSFIAGWKKWWSWGDSNPLPHPCKGCALPDELQPHLVSREFHPLIRFLQVLLYLGCAVTGNRQTPCFVCYGVDRAITKNGLGTIYAQPIP